jgi:hypothetical protein
MTHETASSNEVNTFNTETAVQSLGELPLRLKGIGVSLSEGGRN